MRAHILNALLALVFSVLIWSAVGAQLSDTAPIDVDFVIRVPPDVTVTYMGKHAAGELRVPIKVDLRGPREVVTRLSGKDVLAQREFSHDQTFLREALAAGGTRTLEIRPDDVTVTRAKVEVDAIRPRSLDIAFSQVVDWEPRLAPPTIEGELAPGYRVASIRLDRTRVAARGPASLRDRYPGPYPVEPVDVTGERVPQGERSYALTVTRGVRTPPGVVCDAQVQVTVTIVPELEVRELLFPVRAVLEARRAAGAEAAAIEPLPASVVPRAPVQDWYWPVPLRGSAADLDALAQRLDQERRSPGSVKNLPVAYVLLTNIPSNDGDVDDLEVSVIGLPDGVTLGGTPKKFPIRVRAQ